MTPNTSKTHTRIHMHAEGAETCFCEAIYYNTFITHTSRVNIHTHNYKNIDR